MGDENNGSKFWEVWEGIIGKILSILGSALHHKFLLTLAFCIKTFMLKFILA